MIPGHMIVLIERGETGKKENIHKPTLSVIWNLLCILPTEKEKK